MYYFVFIVLLFFSVMEIGTARKNLLWFNIAYVLMLFMAMFRYGQLADYINYEDVYVFPESTGIFGADQSITDPLFFFLIEAFKFLGFSYQGFVMIVAMVTMGLSYPFFYKQCKGSIFALMVFYCYVFLILPMSAIRQGICLSMMLYGFSLLVEGKKIRYCILVLIGMFVHFSMIACILIAFLYDKKFFNKSFVSWGVLGVTCFAVVIPDLTSYLPEFIIGKSLGEYGESKLLQVLIRFLLILPVLYVKPDPESDIYYAKAICIVGYVIYCLFSFIPTASARMEFYFRVFLCLYVASLVLAEERIYFGNMLLGTILAIHVFLFFKNMNAAIAQGEYNQDKVTMFNFPYVSIFDKEELQQYK